MVEGGWGGGGDGYGWCVGPFGVYVGDNNVI